jgi:hypothetical protein
MNIRVCYLINIEYVVDNRHDQIVDVKLRRKLETGIFSQILHFVLSSPRFAASSVSVLSGSGIWLEGTSCMWVRLVG